MRKAALNLLLFFTGIVSAQFGQASTCEVTLTADTTFICRNDSVLITASDNGNCSAYSNIYWYKDSVYIGGSYDGLTSTTLANHQTNQSLDANAISGVSSYTVLVQTKPNGGFIEYKDVPVTSGGIFIDSIIDVNTYPVNYAIRANGTCGVSKLSDPSNNMVLIYAKDQLGVSLFWNSYGENAEVLHPQIYSCFRMGYY